MDTWICSQINFVESLLLMRTSSRRSLALTCLYSLYSAASGERSSFCTFLWEQDGKRWDGLSGARGYNYVVTNDAGRIFSLGRLPNVFPYLPFCLKNWSSNSFRFLRSLFLSSRASWSCSTSSCLRKRGDRKSKISLGTVTMIGDFVEDGLYSNKCRRDNRNRLTWWRSGGWTVSCPSSSTWTVHPRAKWNRPRLPPCGPGSWARWGRRGRSPWTASSSPRRPRSRPPPPAGEERRQRHPTRLRRGTASVQLPAGGMCVSQPRLWIITVQPHNALQRWLLTYRRS